MDYTNNKIYQLAILVLGTAGTIMVTYGLLSAEANQTLQDLLPEIAGVAMQVISFLQMIGVIKKKEEVNAILRLEKAQQAETLERLRSDVERLKSA